MPRTPQKPTIPANAVDQTAQTVAVPEHTTLQLEVVPPFWTVWRLS